MLLRERRSIWRPIVVLQESEVFFVLLFTGYCLVDVLYVILVVLFAEILDSLDFSDKEKKIQHDPTELMLLGDRVYTPLSRAFSGLTTFCLGVITYSIVFIWYVV